MMYIDKDKIPTILNEYLHKVMIPKSPSSTHTFLSGIAVGFGIRKAKQVLTDAEMLETLATLGVVDSKGRINLDELYKVADDAVRVSGAISIPVINYNVDSSDFRSIYEIAKAHAVLGESANGTDDNVQRSSF